MYELRHINAQNIVSFGDLTLDIEQGVATAIIGENRDDQSQKVNGSGKSAVIEAIAIGLTGEPLRKVKTDEFISDWADEACVELHLHNTFTNRDFIISRSFARKSPQVIECHIYDCEKQEDVETDKTVQPSVNDYNKFIMSELGISKDDLFNYYILSSKYESFFEASDRAKKELINTFSNGVLVDQSVEKLEIDLQPLEENVVKANHSVISTESRIEAIDKEINNAFLKNDEIKKNKEVKIAEYNQNITDKRSEIREHRETIGKANARIQTLSSLPKELEEITDDGSSIIDIYNKVSDMFEENKLAGLPDVPSLSKEYFEDLEEIKESIKKYSNKVKATEAEYSEVSADVEKLLLGYQRASKKHDDLDEKANIEISKYNKKLDEYDKQLDNLDKEITEQHDRENKLVRYIDSLNNILAGLIECPNCHHKFSLTSDRPLEEIEKDVDEKEVEKKEIETSISKMRANEAEIDKEYEVIQDKIDEIDGNLKESKKSVNELFAKYDGLNKELSVLKSKLNNTKIELEDCNQKAVLASKKIENLKEDMLDKASNIVLSAIENGKRYVESQEQTIASLEANIEVYQNSIKTLEEASDSNFEESLKKSKEEYEKQLEMDKQKLQEATTKRDDLMLQKQTFLSFKAHLANTKLKAISQIVNNVLEEICSNIRVDLQGYRVLRTGKLKENITVQLLKDGRECGSFYKFSAGERCRVNLASIIALQRLTNANCEDGKGLGLLVFDEILDSSDQVGFMSYCSTINKLQMTSLLITQNSLPENYPYSLTVVKENGMSHILTD